MAKSPVQIQQIDQVLATSPAFVVLPKTNAPFTTIVKRAQVTNFANDLLPRMGIERFQFQTLCEISNESGPAGETVYTVGNDFHNRLRLIGSWNYETGNDGVRVFNVGTTTDYLELTFYGTGVNMLSTKTSNRNVAWSVDGDSETLISAYDGTFSVSGRYYTVNAVAPLVSNLTLGMHTLKLRSNSSAALQLSGFEILTNTTTIRTTAGSAYIGGKKLTLSAADSQAYNSGFTNQYGTAGARGGRVLMYLKPDDTIAKDIQWTNTAQATLTSADHTNEEVLRTYNFREFGAGRTDDLSSLTSTNSDRAFTLDDGTTCLIGDDMSAAGPGIFSGLGEALTGSSGGAITITFVGTGLDVISLSDGSRAWNNGVFLNGTTLGTPTFAAGLKTSKIVSGLPYGTHTVRFVMNVGSNTPAMHSFVVYGPKKPALPVDCIELADYNIMATYVANATQGDLFLGTGLLRKTPLRELRYTGTWGGGIVLDVNSSNGYYVVTSVNGDFFQYTFYGTGFDFRFYSPAAGGANIFQASGVFALD